MRFLSRRASALAAIGLSAALVLTACGSDGDGCGGSSGDEDVTITMLPKNLGNPYFDTSTAGAKKAAKDLGVELEDMVGRFCGDVLHPIGPDGVRPCDTDCPILRAREGGSGRATEVLERPDGTHRTVVITSAEAADGMQVQVMRDETQVEAVRRARDHVLANIAHEFRTPLAAQLASIELLQDGLEHMTTAEQRELFQHLERGVLRLMRLIDNLLESVRIESGQLAIRSQTVELPQVAEEASALVRPLLAQRRQTIVAEWPDAMPAIVGDGQRLTQVFVNLLSNASKFAPEGTPIRLGPA